MNCPGSVATCSKRQAHQLFHRQRQDAEHKMGSTPSPGPRTLRCHPPNSSLSRPFTRSTVERSRVAPAPQETRDRYSAAPAPPRFRSAFTCGRLRGLRSMIGDMAQLLTEDPDLGRVVGAVHQVVEVVDPTRGQPRQRDRRLTVVHRG